MDSITIKHNMTIATIYYTQQFTFVSKIINAQYIS